MSDIVTATATQSRLPLAPIDAELFRTHFNRRPFKIGHFLADDPRLTIERLVELADRLPAESVEYNAGNLPVSQDPSRTPRNGLSPEETIRRIADCQSWLVLKNVERVPEYGAILDACLDQVRELSEAQWPGMHRREAFVFVSSPGSVTPFHIDPENNFLLQIRGTKRVQLFSAQDRFVLREEDLEQFYAGGHRNLQFREEFRTRGDVFELAPGEGLHFPVVAPHWVQNGPEVSVSLSITFRTRESSDRESLYRFNRSLRRARLAPTPVGSLPGRDRVKLGLIRCARAVKSLLGLRPTAGAGY